MYDENKLVKVKWNNSNKIWYENKGYKYTKRYDEFYVKQSELTPKSKYPINAICDYCGNSYTTTYGVIYNGRKNIKKDCCSRG